MTFKQARPIEPLVEENLTKEGPARPLVRVTYPELWPGISVIYESAGGMVTKSTFWVKPGARIEDIQLCYNVPLSLDDSGGLRWGFKQGEFRESAPTAWQEKGGVRVPVRVSFYQRADREIGFSAHYDPSYPLVIDPNLTWNTFLGGTDFFVVQGLATDSSGNLFITGFSSVRLPGSSPLQPYAGGEYDAFVAKLNAGGYLLWYTFLGGPGYDYAKGITVDGSGNIYITGASNKSWGFPVRAYTGGEDAFAAKLNADGALQWNTFLGQSFLDQGYGVAVAEDGGSLLVTGISNATWGKPVRDYSGGWDAFAAKLNAYDGVLQWNTFLGGGGTDSGYGITVDGSGNIYITGSSRADWGSPLRPHSGDFDAFVAKLNAGGALQWNTFLGGAVPMRAGASRWT